MRLEVQACLSSGFCVCCYEYDDFLFPPREHEWEIDRVGFLLNISQLLFTSRILFNRPLFHHQPLPLLTARLILFRPIPHPSTTPLILPKARAHTYRNISTRNPQSHPIPSHIFLHYTTLHYPPPPLSPSPSSNYK